MDRGHRNPIRRDIRFSASIGAARMKLKTLTFALLLLLSTSLASTKPALAQESGGGPRVDNLIIKIYPNYNAEMQAFEAGQIDLLNSPLNSTLKNKYSTLPWNLTVSLDSVSELAMYRVDINNKDTILTYPNWSSSTSSQAFRHAIAHLTDKSGYVNTILGGYGTVLNTPVMPWMSKWYNPLADPHTYNRTEAAITLDAGGYTDANGDGIRDYPPEHEIAGENTDSIIFFAPAEDPALQTVAQRLTSEMQLIGIPVNLTIADETTIFNSVIQNKDFHLYIGKQDMYHSDVSADTAATGFGNLYHLDMYGAYGANYIHFNNTQFNNYVQTLRNADDEGTAITAAKEAQRVLADQVGIIPLFATVGYKAHKSQWVDTVNEVGNGVDNWWTFMMAHQEGSPTGGTLQYGIIGDPCGINPLLSDLRKSTTLTALMYDSLLRVRDMESVVSGAARNWEMGTWFNPDTGMDSTKLTFYLNQNLYFHDGVQLTSADVNFTIGYLKSHPVGTNYAKVTNVHHIDTPNLYTVVVYENVTSLWALDWIGSLPILPKHKWQTITNPYVATPEPTVTGSGPFKFAEYVPGSHISLTANRNYPVHDVAIVDVLTFPAPYQEGQLVSINVTVQNQRDFTEAVKVSVYYQIISDPLIGTQNLTLGPGSSKTITFGLTPPIAAIYRIRAEVSVIASEPDTTDNSMSEIISVGYGAGAAQLNSDSSSLNLGAALFGLFSIVLLAPDLSRRKRRHDDETPMTRRKSLDVQNDKWRELIRHDYT